MMPKSIGSPIVGVIVYAKDTNEILLLKNEDGNWGIPAGKIHRNETPYIAALRELNQETGLAKSSVLARIGRSTFRNRSLTRYLLIKKERPLIKISAEHVDKKWVNPEKIPKEIKSKLICAGDISILLSHLQTKNCPCAQCA